MKAIGPVQQNQVNLATQPQKSDGKAKNSQAVNFNSVFELVRRSMDGVMVVAGNNRSAASNLDKDKLEIEKKRGFSTDLEEAQAILAQITRIMDKQGKSVS
jgi:hypothetical protein